jgi:hypothetical protein
MGHSLFCVTQEISSATKSRNLSSEGCPEYFGGLIFADSRQIAATLHAETRVNTAETLQIKNFNDSPMSV